MRRELAAFALLAAACGRTALDEGVPGVRGIAPMGGTGQAAARSTDRGGTTGTAGTTGSGGEDGGTSTVDAGEIPRSCAEIQEVGLGIDDGIYVIRVGTGPAIEVHCLMSADSGGWTLVGNFPWPGNTAGVPGWTSGAAVGASFTDLTRPFKLSDADINALRFEGFRAHGSASFCTLADGTSTGPCAIETWLFWRATCHYASGSNSPACNTAYRDAAMTIRASGGAPCDWHFGLTASNCNGTLATMGTSHSGDHIFVGDYESFTHAFDGRPNENPSVQFWVR